MTNLQEIPQEIWLPVKRYEKLYHISNLGRVKRINKRTAHRILKPYINNSGYFVVSLSKEDKKKSHRVHKLVAGHFLLKPRVKNIQTNHKDGNKLNNYVTNLEWCTPTYNVLHALKLGLIKNKTLRRVNQATWGTKPSQRRKTDTKFPSYILDTQIIHFMKSLNAEFESPLPHNEGKMKPVPVAGFIINKKFSVKTVSKIYYYRKPVIVKGKYGWYVQYYYRIPVELRETYNNKEWFRFRVKEDMNRRKGHEREEYAEWLRNEIEETLRQGYNPFNPDFRLMENKEVNEEKDVSATDAIELFLEAWNKRGLQKESISKYSKVANRLIEWLALKKIPYTEITSVTNSHIETFLQDLMKHRNFSNREYNNHLNFTRTIFNWFKKKKFITDNPCDDIEKLKAKTSKHRYYDNTSLEKIKSVLLLTDPYLYFACQVTYYACIRSDKELMNLKVANLDFSQNTIFIEAEGAKGGRGSYIPMDEKLKQLFIEREIDKADPSFYVFGIKGAPSSQPFGKGFFSKRFRKIRENAGLPNVFTVYGFKFTRVVHLKHDGLDDASIMTLTRHSDFTSYAKYLRNLGLEASPDKMNKVSRQV